MLRTVKLVIEPEDGTLVSAVYIDPIATFTESLMVVANNEQIPGRNKNLEQKERKQLAGPILHL